MSEQSSDQGKKTTSGGVPDIETPSSGTANPTKVDSSPELQATKIDAMPEPNPQLNTEARTMIDTEDNADPLIDTMIGNLHVQRILGVGGFGSVYLAKDTMLDRRVALKFLLDTVDGDHKKLFVREAKAIAALGKHPGIVQIHAWGEEPTWSSNTWTSAQSCSWKTTPTVSIS